MENRAKNEEIRNSILENQHESKKKKERQVKTKYNLEKTKLKRENKETI